MDKFLQNCTKVNIGAVLFSFLLRDVSCQNDQDIITDSTAFEFGLYAFVPIGDFFLPICTMCFNFAPIYYGICCGVGNDKVVHPFR